MKWNIINQPLGGVQSSGATHKQMPVPLAVPLAMGAASAISSIWGGSKAADAAREQQRIIEEQKSKLEAERLRKVNEDYLDTAAGQNLMRVAREERDKIWKRAAGQQAVAGGTDASVQVAKDSANKMIGDTIANISAQDSSRKDNIDASYRSEISRLDQQLAGFKGAEASAISQAAGGASGALLQAGISAFGGTKLGQSWFGGGGTAGTGSPGGGGVTPSGGGLGGGLLSRYTDTNTFFFGR